MSNSEMPPPSESIAIIGMSGRFPKARDLDEFWRNLRDGVECISFFSEADLDSAGADPGALDDPNFVNAGGVLEDVDLFDAPFFGFSARDAEIMDPQQRIFLECAWQSLENAGYNPETYPGLIGVFAGTAMSTYLFNLYADGEGIGFVDEFQMMIGNDKDHLTTQVSYKLNLRGPSVAVQTACSTSLVAVCMACQSLLNYQCDMALAGGVAVNIFQRKGYFYQPGGILSPDGHCRVFDAGAQGIVIGNGVGIVVLKRLSEALADGDHIDAVIKGFAINNDGSLKVGYTAPSVDGQAQVIAMAQAMAGVEPESISYIEAHGTATPLGDPIEIAALNQVFRARTKRKGFCAIGSVKSNIGHLDPAAGVAGLIKTVLALQHELLPPSVHFQQPNPEIDFANSPFYVNAKLSEWKSDGFPRRAGVSSFGIGGTNAHVVLEEGPRIERTRSTRPCSLLVLSAKTSTALETATVNLVDYLAQHMSVDLADVAYSYQVGRKSLKYRRALVCRNVDTAEAASALERTDPQRVFTAVCEPNERPIALMFPGQGTQHIDMALEVYRVEPTFREQVDLCSELLKPHLGLDLRDLLYPAAGRREDAAHTLGQTAFTQPALFTVEYALARLWMEWGIRPWAMIGHSIGEYVAACLAGVLCLKDALGLVAARGQLMEQMPAGAMLAVPLSEAEVQSFLENGLSLAAVNGPSLCVLSGPTDSIDRLAVELAETGTRYRPLRTSHAFHSGTMDPIELPYVTKVKEITLKPPQTPYLSNVTGTWITAEAAIDPRYWGRQLRQTVRFADGLQQLLKTPGCILLEVGPGQTLSTLARQQPGQVADQFVFSSLPAPRDQGSDVSSLLETLGKLWLCGVRVDWNGFYAHERRRRLHLPTYPFERQRYWIGPPEYQDTAGAEAVAPAARDIADWFYTPSWTPAMPSDTPVMSDKTSRWLVFTDAAGLGSLLIQRLRERGDEIATVIIGDQFARLDALNYTIRPQERGDYEMLLKDVRLRIGAPNAIVHLWTVSVTDQEQSGAVWFEQCQRLGFYSIVFLAQALEKQNFTAPIKINVVSNQIQAVIGDEALCPDKATVLGPCKVVPQEYPNIRCRSVDIDFYRMNEQQQQKLVDLLVTELTVEPFESVVAYRKGRRWIQTFEPAHLGEGAGSTPRLRQGGVYLITGGLGSIGLVLAEFLARTVQAKLVLIGRSAFPARSEWEQYLQNDPEGTISRRIRKLLQLEELGAEAMVFSADSADHEQMRRAVDQAYAHFGTIHGVIHGAGDTSAYSAVSQTDGITADQQFRPKVRGLLVLEELLRERELDFVLLLSSLSSVLGGLGLVAYSAANIFLDAFSSQRNLDGSVPWISVNWDAWQFPPDDEPEERSYRSSEDFILPREGAEAFRRILDRAPRQIVVSTSDLQARFDQWIKLISVQQTRPSEKQGAARQHTRPNLSNQYVAPKNAMEQTLTEIWQQLLGVAPVGTYDNFFELGGHSLLAIQLISRLRETFEVEFPVQKLFDAPTIAELAESIEENRPAKQDEMKITQILDLVERLSDSEIEALLEREGNPFE